MAISGRRHVQAARAGDDPQVICRVLSGWVSLCDMQFLSGYCILTADPVVESINALNPQQRVQYLSDMTLVGDALLEVTGAYRINYAIAGNSDPILHAHIVPRYSTEPERFRVDLPWSYPQDYKNAHLFDPERDQDLMVQLRHAIQRRF